MSQIQQRSLLNSNFLLNSVVFIILLFLSVQYKVDNFPAIRPLYTAGLILLLSTLILQFGNLKIIKRVVFSWLSTGLFPFLLLLLLMFISSLFSGERTIKDSLYTISWITLLPSLFLIMIYKGYISSIARVLSYFAIFASIISILVFSDIIYLEYDNYRLVQNFWTAKRLHGFMGQPSAFGALIGMTLIFFIYLPNYRKVVKYLIGLFLILSLVLSGSRNGILSLLLAILFPLIFLVKTKPMTKFKYIIFSITILLILSLFLYYFDRLDIFRIIFARGDIGKDYENNRIVIWLNVIELFRLNSESIFSMFFGAGYGNLSSVYRSAFNVPLHLLHDFGLIGFMLYISSFILSLLVGCKRFYISGNIIYKIGIMLTIYGFVFNLIISSFLSPFFSFQVFSLILGMLILNTPIRWLPRVEGNKII